MYRARLAIAVVFAAYHVFIVGAALAPLFPKISKLEWQHNMKYLNVTTKVLSDERSYNQSYVFDMIIMRDMNDVRMNVGYSIRALNGTIESTIYTRSLELCQFIKRPNMDRLMKIFYQAINQTSNLPTRCPFRKGISASLNFVSTSMPVPGFFPETDFLATVNFCTGLRQEPILESRWYGRLTKN